MIIRTMVAALTLLAGHPAFAQQSLSQTVSPQGEQKKDPRELVRRIKDTSVNELMKLDFVELYFLKNAIYASKGYKFADDREWLISFFCNKQSNREKKRRNIKQQKATTMQAQEKTSGTDQSPWNLDAYAFPACAESGDLNEDQKKALANIRIATLKKVDAAGNLGIENALLNWSYRFPRVPGDSGKILLLGKAVDTGALGYNYDYAGYRSITRDLHGYAQMLYLIKNIEREEFDAMELLGLYVGDILFLRNVIEAKYGKPMSGALGWEIGQLIGITEKKADYDVQKLPINIQVKIQMIDDVIKKILESDLNDVPATLKNKPIDFREDPYRGGAC